MSRYRRVMVPGGCFFFTVVTLRRLPVFADEAMVSILRAAFRQVKSKHPFEIDAMVLLPDHLHCIWRLPEGDADYSGRWEMIKKASNWMATVDINKPVQLWQQRFWEHLIRDEEDWKRHLDYIHFNPVKHGLAKSPAAWPHSSFHKAIKLGWYESDWGKTEPNTITTLNVE